ncbi:MAG: MFS transporter [Chloroflexota bacterium]
MTETAAPTPALVRQPDFVKLWTAETISQFGTQVSQLAIPLIAANVLQVSPFEFGLLSTIEFLPFILLSLPAGVSVDRMRRRPILIVGDIGRAIALASIPIAFVLGVLTIWQLYVVAFITGCLTVFFDVAYQSYLPSLIRRDKLVEGNSKLEITRSAAQVLGPGIAGFVIGAIGAAVAVVLDSLSFVGSALFVFLIRRREPDPGRREDGTSHPPGPGMRAEIRDGLDYVLGNRFLRAIAACTALSNLAGNLAGAILILYMTRTIGLDPAAIGLVFSIGSLGFLAGAVVANRVAARLGVGMTIIAAEALMFPAMLLIAVAPIPYAVPFLTASWFLQGLSTSVYNINQVSFRQAITPERMQGRMNATMRFIVWGTIPVGALLGGFLGGAIGLHETIWVGTIGAIVPLVIVLLSPVREVREMPTPVDEAPAAGEPGQPATA